MKISCSKVYRNPVNYSGSYRQKVQEKHRSITFVYLVEIFYSNINFGEADAIMINAVTIWLIHEAEQNNTSQDK